MSRRQQRTGGGLTDRLPLARGAALGAAAYVVGFIITYVFVEMESDGADTEQALGQFGSTFGVDIGMTDLVGWFFYSSHFVDTTVSAEALGESQSQSANMLSEVTDLTIPEPIWYLVPIVCLLVAGYVTAKAISNTAETADAAKAGATVIAGYLPLAAVGTFIFSKSGDFTRSSFGQSVSGSISMGPDMMMALLLAGLAYPLVLGAIGGALSTAGSSSGGGYQQRSPRQQQPPQQRNPPQGGNPPQQGHAGQQQGHTGQQQGHTGQQQGHAGQQQRGPGGHQQQDQNQGNRR